MSLRYKDSSQNEVIYTDGHRKFRVMSAELALRESSLRVELYNLIKGPLERHLTEKAQRHIPTKLIGSVPEGGADQASDIDILVGLNVRNKKELRIWIELLHLNEENPDNLLGIEHSPYELHFHAPTKI